MVAGFAQFQAVPNPKLIEVVKQTAMLFVTWLTTTQLELIDQILDWYDLDFPVTYEKSCCSNIMVMFCSFPFFFFKYDLSWFQLARLRHLNQVLKWLTF